MAGCSAGAADATGSGCGAGCVGVSTTGATEATGAGAGFGAVGVGSATTCGADTRSTVTGAVVAIGWLNLTVNTSK